MARLILLATDTWDDLSLDQLAHQAVDWGYQGLDLCCWGDHFEVQRALGEEEYCPNKLALFNRLDFTVPVLSVHRLSQAVSDNIGPQHRDWLPDYVWGDGDPDGVRERAVEELLATFQAAQQLGVSVISGYSGSPIWPAIVGSPPITSQQIDEGLQTFLENWTPILDACLDLGLKYAFEVHPGQMAFDFYSADRLLDALEGREEIGFTLDPSQLYWQGIDPVEFIRKFGERIYHVHIKDVALTLNGRTGLLNSALPSGDPRRGWDTRSPGRGSIDWEGVIRALNEVHYDGPLAVAWSDPGMNREIGAEEACKFVKRLDFEKPPHEAPAFV